jgi:quercetin dioxygenase-like cupin family protein
MLSYQTLSPRTFSIGQFTHVVDLAKEATPPEHGILSHTVFQDDDLKAVVFGFGQGDEMSEHTASTPAILHFLEGEAELILGEETVAAQAGSWIHMAAGLPHTVLAKTPTTMLLLLLKK